MGLFRKKKHKIQGLLIYKHVQNTMDNYYNQSNKHRANFLELVSEKEKGENWTDIKEGKRVWHYDQYVKYLHKTEAAKEVLVEIQKINKEL